MREDSYGDVLVLWLAVLGVLSGIGLIWAYLLMGRFVLAASVLALVLAPPALLRLVERRL